MVNENYLYKSTTHAANLNGMRLSGKLCDVTVKVEQSEFRAHKVVLAANLKYFESMFLNSFEESKQNVVTMKDLDKGDLEAFITYAYTGEMMLTTSNALGLLEVADYLNENGVRAACIDFLEKHLDASDAFRAYKFANAVECLSLKNAAKSIIQSNFGDCSQSTDYLDLDVESLKNVLSDFKFDHDGSQQLLFEGIMRWIMHDPKNRRIHVNDLLGFINITELAADYLMKYIASMADHKDDDYGIIKDMLSHYHRCCQIRQSKQLVKCSGEVLMLLGDIEGKHYLHLYNFGEKKWSNPQELPDVHRETISTSAILRDRLYYTCEYSSMLTLHVFNPTTKRDTRLCSSNTILRYSALCACDRFIYSCSGQNSDSLESNQILRYDPETNSTVALTPMRTKRFGPAAIFYQGHLLVLGGYDGSSYLDSVEKYDPATNEWAAFPPMRTPRLRHAVAVLDQQLYACGGRYGGNSNSVEVYDPATNSWTPVASMNKKRTLFLALAREGKLFAIGGDEEKTVEVFDPSKNQWQMDHEMSSGLHMRYPAGGLISVNCVTNTK